MKKLFKNITAFIMITVMMFGVLENAQALGNNLLISTTSTTIPLQQVVVYQSQSVSYDNFDAAIFAQGQLDEAAKLPASSEVALYVDTSKVNGPVGLQTGTRCSAEQASADYYQNTITMDKRFCIDFNDAILDGRAVYGVVPKESVFLHKGNGERCSVTGNGGAVYMTNPASTFLKNYLVNRGVEKLKQFNLDTFFLDNLQAGWDGIIAKCGGNPKEYSNSSDYLTQMVGLAKYVHDNLPHYKVEGNLGGATSQWDKFVFLDGAMCENCFTNWGGAWPSAARMLADLVVMDNWIKGGRKIYIISQAPDTSDASNRFTFAASLLVANGDRANFHFGSDYGQFYPLPEYQYNLGIPLAERVCNGNTCVRPFEHGTVMVDFGMLQGTILMQEPTSSQITPASSPPTAISLGVFRPSNGILYLQNANTNGFTDVTINYGYKGDYPIVADWDSNGTDTIGIYRNGTFYLRNSNTPGFADLVFAFGAPGDQPVAGDWDGDGIDTIGVYRNGTFLLRNSNSTGGADISFALGNPGDIGIAGDWNGDGLDTTGVFRPSNGVIFLKNMNTSGFADVALNYGLAGDQPVIGDWNNDGVDTIGVYRNAQFYLRNSNTIGFADLVVTLGVSGDMPIIGNWDGNP